MTDALASKQKPETGEYHSPHDFKLTEKKDPGNKNPNFLRAYRGVVVSGFTVCWVLVNCQAKESMFGR